MHLILSLVTVLGALAVGVVSPGPSFLMVARTAVARSRGEGIAAALGMGLGGMVFAIVALLGLTAAIAAAPSLYLAVRILGALYLGFLGCQIWRGAGRPLSDDALAFSGRASRIGAFCRGLGTQLSNPKTAIVYGSVFATLLPQGLPLVAALVLPVLVFALETSWYLLVALTLSASGPRGAYLRSKRAIDRTAGAVMALLGAKLLFNAFDGLRG